MAQKAGNAATRILAGEQLKDVFGLDQRQIQGLAALGYNLYQQGKFKEAGTIFRGLIAADEKSYYGYAGLGALYLAHNPPDLKRAQENLLKAAELNPEDASVQANLGEVLLRQAKFDESAKLFKKAMELDPKQHDPGANRARAIVGGMNTVISELQRIERGHPPSSAPR